MYCVVAKRLDISQYNLLSTFRLRGLPSQNIPHPLATTSSKTIQRSADFYDKMECDRRKHLYLKIYQSVSVYFIIVMKVNKKRRLERATLNMLARKLILKMQMGL